MSLVSGFTVDPEAVIRLIQGNLLDRYPAEAILKELIQNADDAKATTVEIGFAPEGLPSATHPLLKGPAVYVWNNAPLTEIDARNVRKFGSNAKYGEKTTVGKFGLGLKSVFHLCEAFFFLSSEAERSGFSDGRYAGLLNPWHGSDHQPEWDRDPSAEMERIRDRIRAGGRGDWFALWLPLRTKHQADGACIHPTVLDVADARSLMTQRSLLAVVPALPLLKSVRRIEAEGAYQLDSGGATSRFADWVENPPTETDERTGIGCIDGPGATVRYVLVERWVPGLLALRDDPSWPHSPSEGRNAPDKAMPHAAVVLGWDADPTAAGLDVRESVFLPLTAPVVKRPKFTMLAHGCFFLDSGRKGVHDGGDTIRQTWNERLRIEGVCPCVLPAVAMLSEQLHADQTRELTAAIKDHVWFWKYREHVCRNGGWAYRWRPGGARWETIPKDVRILEIPAFPDHGLPACALPGLAGLAGDYALVPAAEPRLLARDPEPWPDDLLGRVLAVPEAQPLLDGAALGYLVEFVRLTSRQFGASARHALAATLRRVFATASNGELAEHKDRLVRLVDEVPPQYHRRLSLGGNWPAKTRQAVCGVQAGILIVPDVLEVSSGVGVLDTPHAVEVLTLLAADMSTGRNTNPAAEVVDASTDPAAVCEAVADLVIWQVQRHVPYEKRDRTELRSRNELIRARDSGTLFCGEAKEEFKELSAAVAVRLIVLKGETAKCLFLGHLPEVSAAGIVEVLMTAPDLHPAEARLPLILRLTTATGDESFRTRRRWAVRYLLHADKELPSKDDLYLPGNGAEVWTRLAREALAALGQHHHLLTGNDLVRQLNSHQREELGLRTLDPEGVAAILNLLPDLSGLCVEDGERDTVLRGLQQHPELIRRLPLHDRVGGGHVCLTNDTYWRDGAGVGLGKLADAVTLVIPHADEVLAAIQKKAWEKILTHRAVVSLAVRHGPAAHWDTLLAAMALVGTLVREQAGQLAEMPWLLLADGKFTSPNRVLHDEEFDDEIAAAMKRIAPAAGDLVPLAHLHPEVRAHAGFTALKRLFPDRKQTLSMLGGLLARSPQFHTGRVEALADWCDSFRGAPPDVMAAAPLIARVHQHAPDECRNHLLPAIDRRPTSDRLEKILAFLRERHDRGAGPRTTLQRVHDTYLNLAAALPEFAQMLPRLLLLNAAETPDWVPTASLCAGVFGVEPTYKLDTVQDEVLGDRVARLEPRDLASGIKDATGTTATAEQAFEDSVRKLRDYFDSWRKSELLSAWAGALLSLLGDYDPIRALATDFLPPGGLPELVRSRSVAGGRTLPTGVQRVLVRVTDPRHPVEVCNLLGEAVTVPSMTNADSLLIGYGLDKVEHRLGSKVNVRCFDLRAAEPGTSPEFRAILAETGNLILRIYYGVPELDARFEDALESFRRDDEYGVQFAQVMFLKEGGDTLRNRGIIQPSYKPLLVLAGRYRQAELRDAQEQIAEQNNPNQSLPGLSSHKQSVAAWDDLKVMIETDATAQMEFLNGVRRRLTQAGYSRRSVPFELFQNADDAYVERREPIDGRAWFGFSADIYGVTVTHDGRPINRPRQDDAYDLRKMLALHHSDKGEDGQRVTGKFGLGFKSVFLVCDEPRIVSGRLAVRVVGGSYPMPLAVEEAKALRAQLTAETRPETSTLFHLPANENAWADDFRRLAHLLPVFARRIREIRVDGRELAWSEREIVSTPTARVVIGRLHAETGIQRAMVVRCGEHGDVLLGLIDDGFASMPADVPSVWVTAPTAEEHRLGYLVNARELPIDIGRSQVAWTHPDTIQVFRGLATVLGEALVTLFDAGVNGLEVSASEPAVWRSFWDVVKTKGERGELQEQLMWGPHGAARHLFTERKALPTGLNATGYRDLTSLGAVRGVVAGIMDQQTDVFGMVAAWDSFQEAYPWGSLVSQSEAGDLFRDVKRIGLNSAVDLEMRKPFVDPSRAAELGHVLSRDRLSKLFDRGGEIERVRDSLKVAKFLNAVDAWVLATELVAVGAKGEEALRAGFAPRDRLLSPDYMGTAVEFFLACRLQMNANTDSLLEWVLQADSKEKQHAALRYFGQGELGQPLLRLVRQCRERWPEWLRKLTAEQLYEAGLDEFAVGQVTTAISPPSTTPSQPFLLPQAPPSQAKAAEVLARIAAWWTQNSKSQLKDYYSRIYPRGVLPAITANGSLRDNPVRVEWLKLLVTGSLQTLGRVKAQQNREFLRICERRNWFEMLADPTEGPRVWLADVQRYVDDPQYHADTIRYFHWLRQFVSFDTIARHLTTYAEAFLSVDRFQGAFVQSDVFTIRSSRQFQGTGLDAPPMQPFLGMGTCFVLRELARSDVATREDVYPYCYMPGGRLRKRLQRLGWHCPADSAFNRSKFIHEFLDTHLDDPTFGGDFDIPLLMWPDWESVPDYHRTSVDGGFVTLGDGRVIPRSYMS